MKWLNTYNNILFAGIGTISILVLAFVALSSVSLFSNNDGAQRGINQEPVQNEDGLAQDGEDQIEFFLGDPELIDSSMSTYIISLYTPENNESFNKYSSSSYRSGLRINLIIHDIENNKVKKLFENLVLINFYEIIRTRNSMMIKVVYSNEDSNANGIIDYDDPKVIGVYDLINEKFSTIPLENKYHSISSVYDQRLNSLLILGRNDIPYEQSVYAYFRYDFDSQTVIELNNPM
jgi:hypothetical protein